MGREADRDRDEDEALSGLESELAVLSARRMADPPLELLRAAREGVLPEALQQRASTHLENDAWSRTLVDDLAALTPEPAGVDAERILARVRAGARRDVSPPVRLALTWRHALAFGSLAAAIALIAVAPDWRRASPGGGAESARATAPAPPPSGGERPSPPPMLLALSKPDLRVSLTALQWRGSPAGNPLLADLKPAFAAIERDDFADAARVLEPLVSRYPASVWWYLAIAAERQGVRPAGRARLVASCRAGGARAERACAAAPTLR
jgi:hypothetical protein